MRKAESTAKVRPIQKSHLLHLSEERAGPGVVELYSLLRVQLLAFSESIIQPEVDDGQTSLITVPDKENIFDYCFLLNITYSQHIIGT